MGPRVLIAGAALVLLAALWFAFSDGPVNVASAPHAVDATLPLPAPQPASPPQPTVRAGAPHGADDAGPPDAPPPAASWKARWSSLPLDDLGRSLSGRGQAKAFNRALQQSIREDLRRCAGARTQQVDQLVNMELFVEATASGYSIVGAEAPADAGLDTYSRRCFELAFEQQLELADAGTTAGVLYRFAYPLQLTAAEP